MSIPASVPAQYVARSQSAPLQDAPTTGLSDIALPKTASKWVFPARSLNLPSPVDFYSHLQTVRRREADDSARSYKGAQKVPIVSAKDEDEDAEYEESDDEEFEELEDQEKEMKRRRRMIALLISVLFSISFTVINHFLFDDGWVTSFYIYVQTMTTVGYGEFTIDSDDDQREKQRLFMCFVVLGMLGMAAYALPILEEVTLSRHVHRLSTSFERFQVKQFAAITSHKEAKQQCGKFNRLGSVSVVYVLAIASGALFFALVESCSCSYGAIRQKRIDDGDLNGTLCPEDSYGGRLVDYDTCVDAGGWQKTPIDALYLSIITSTTIGYGDLYPVSWWGRIFTCFFMIYGTLASAAFVGTLSSTLFDVSDEQEKSEKVIEEIGGIDNRVYTRAQFFEYMLIKNRILTKKSFNALNEIYDSMDPTGKGHVDHEDVLYYEFGGAFDREEQAPLFRHNTRARSSPAVSE